MGFAIATLVAAALVAGLFAVLRDRLIADPLRARRRTRAGSVRAASPRAGSCPLCLSFLGPGERIKSDISPGGGDRIMRIFGCPHCWPPGPTNPRICPVCGGRLAPEAWAVARYFERPGRGHVHVLGCPECRGKRR
ncbi:MAG: hypothetical protein ACLQMF_17715 [Rectinemataceae bacterium]